MSVGRILGSVVVAGAMVLSACSDATNDAQSELPTAETTSPSSTGAKPTTTTPGNLDAEEGTMSDTFGPSGSVTGGNVVVAYPADTFPPELSGIIGLAITDLAERLAVDESTINVVSVEEVTWSDASLGCPDPEMSYAQVTTDGLRILLESDGSVYDYRSGGTADPMLCEQETIKDDDPAGTYEITEDGEVVPVTTPGKDGDGPTEGNNPPDE